MTSLDTLVRPTAVTLPCRFALAAVALTLFAGPLDAAPLAHNLLTNGGFATGLEGWTNVSTASWIGTDHAGQVGSGAARVQWANAPASVGGPVQCVAVTGGEDYVASARVLLTESVFPYAGVSVTYFAGPDCDEEQGEILDSLESDYTFAAGSWQTVGLHSVAPPGAESAGFQIFLSGIDEGPQYADSAFFGLGTCAPSVGRLCLNNDRFAVTATWARPGASGTGLAFPFGDDSGNFTFFRLDNVEIDVKVLDGCAVNNRYWVFAAGLTNVGVTLTVTDTATGQSKVYKNPNGKVFKPVTDTTAFATCP